MVKAKGVNFQVTPFNTQHLLHWSPFASNHKVLCDMQHLLLQIKMQIAPLAPIKIVYMHIEQNEILSPYVPYKEYSHENLWDERYHNEHRKNSEYLNFSENVS